MGCTGQRAAGQNVPPHGGRGSAGGHGRTGTPAARRRQAYGPDRELEAPVDGRAEPPRTSARPCSNLRLRSSDATCNGVVMRQGGSLREHRVAQRAGTPPSWAWGAVGAKGVAGWLWPLPPLLLEKWILWPFATSAHQTKPPKGDPNGTHAAPVAGQPGPARRSTCCLHLLWCSFPLVSFAPCDRVLTYTLLQGKTGTTQVPSARIRVGWTVKQDKACPSPIGAFLQYRGQGGCILLMLTRAV